MEIEFNLLNIVLLVCIIQGAIMGIRIFFKKDGNAVANRFLGLFIACISLELTHLFFSIANIFGQNPDLYMMPIYSSFAFGPLLYWYVHSLTKPDILFHWRKQGWHFIPVFIQFIFYCILGASSYETKNWFWGEYHSIYTYPFENNFKVFSFSAYLIASLWLVRQYQKQIKETYASLDKVTLQWLYRLLIVLFIVYFIDFTESYVHEFFDYHPFHAANWLPAVTVYWLGWTVLMRNPLEKAELLPLKTDTTLQKKSNTESIRLLDEVSLASTSQELSQKMEAEQWYLNPTLKLSDLSKEMNLPVKTLSYVINTGIGKSFYDFVNLYRVEEFQKRIKQDNYAHLSLLGVAYDCGFNSKATFNRIFKKFTGISPSVYQRENLCKMNDDFRITNDENLF
ncbi:MAG: AraC-like DNA-binding protein [Saprospiraceae bacterium]|jgi:AraC-like DNA-binding protein